MVCQCKSWKGQSPTASAGEGGEGRGGDKYGRHQVDVCRWLLTVVDTLQYIRTYVRTYLDSYLDGDVSEHGGYRQASQRGASTG